MNSFGDWFRSAMMRRTQRDAKLLLESGLFDLRFYASQLNADEEASTFHFLKKGWRRGLSPSPFFDSMFYLLNNSDVKQAGWNPLLHYLRHGRKEGRAPHPSFKVHEYIAHHPHINFESIDPLQHCIQHYGSFSWGVQAASAPQGETAEHFTAVGEEAQVRALFDAEYYLSMYEDIQEPGLDPFLHYSLHGWRENRNPSPEFDTWYFLKNHPEFAAAQDSPLHQFVRAGMPAHWPLRSPDSITINPESNDVLTSSSGEQKLRLAVHVHAFYPEFIEEVYHALIGINTPLILFITTCSPADQRFIYCYLERRRPPFPFKVQVTENRGRDIGPMFAALPEMWANYDVVAHIHSKKSPHTGFGEIWRRYVLDQMLGSQALVACILEFLKNNEDVGFLFPDNLQVIKEHVEWGQNAPMLNSILERINLPKIKLPAIAEFAAGSMAWFRTSVFRPLVDSFNTFEDFDLEEGQLDTTLAHALERVFPLIAKAQDFRSVCYYPKRRSHLPDFQRQYTRTEGPQRAEIGWPRDSVQAAAKLPVPLKPLSRVFNARELDIHWVIPDFIKGAGGHMTIFRFVEMLERFGHRQTIWIQNPGDSAAEAKVRIESWYCQFKGNVFVNLLPDDTRQMAGDVIIATDCWTVYPVASASNFKERFYFIQDYEPYFHSVGENFLVAEQTYKMELCGLCAGDWLVKKMQDFGMWVAKWDLAADDAVYFPARAQQVIYSNNEEICIAFYSREYTPRRAKRLGIAAFEELERRGFRFRVIMFGETSTGVPYSFKCEEKGIVTPQQLSAIYHASHVGVVFSTTNYSLVPLEMMGCDLPVVEIDGESTRAIFKYGEVSFAAPNPRAVADAIESLVKNPDLRTAQQARARTFVGALKWEKSGRAVETALLTRLHERGFQAIEPETICTPAICRKRVASVFIPTFNAGPQFKSVLERVTEQDTSFDYDVLVIDSGSTDSTTELVRSFKSKNVRLMEIPNNEFQHGRTRNLGISATDGDYIAILTQDSTPCDRDWLRHLIGGFALSPRVGGVIGRHTAYPEHGLFVARDINGMFDRMADFGPLYSLKEGLPSFIYPAGMAWQMILQFYSDNNSAMAREVWKVLPYPEVEWGEDQVWAWEMLRAGFHKGYIDQARVFHSHCYTTAERFRVSVDEGMLFARHFGWDLHPNRHMLDIEIEAANARDSQFAIANRISYRQLNAQKQLNRATIEGRARGAALACQSNLLNR